MSKVAVVYWSGTGNTAAMATAVAEDAREKGAVFACDSVICREAPGEDALSGCKVLGVALV